MPDDIERKAAEALEGVALPHGWAVIVKVTPLATATGGMFSVGYVVRHEDGREGFLKVLDYSAALLSPDVPRALQAMTEAYNHERDLLLRCRAGRMDRIATPIGYGEVDVGKEFGLLSRVNYLIFQRADGDVRWRMDLDGGFEVAWRLRTLHHVATGLQQLHSHQIAHQDVKPSNILMYSGGAESKVADLGTASLVGHQGPFDDFPVAGDPTYAPVELLYRQVDPDWRRRRFGCDLYLLGGMAVFMFSRVVVTAAILDRLHPGHRPDAWGGDYAGVLPHIRQSWDQVIGDFEKATTGLTTVVGYSLGAIVRQLTDPDPALRGDPRGRRPNGNPCNLERYVSFFNLMAGRAAYHRSH
jgi:serine/threonine protein kinase